MSIVIGKKTVSDIQIVSKTVERIEIGGKTAYELPEYLCFTDVSGSSNTLTLTKNGDVPSVSLEYSTDKVNWTTWTESNGVRTYTIPANGKVYLRGVNSNGTGTDGTNYHVFSSTKNVNASGNVVTVLDGIGINTDNIHLSRLFWGMTTLKTTPSFPNGGLVLGSNALSEMYEGCTGLTTTPAFTVSSFTGINAMNDMFKDCTGLTSASNIHLNATNIPTNTYWATFNNCSSLTALPVFTSSPLSVGENGMRGMFYNCTSLTTAPSFTISSTDGNNCCYRMLYGCVALTDASNIHLNATSIKTGGYQEMFAVCSSMTSYPSITSSALTLEGSALLGMFKQCSSLTAAPNLNITTLNSSGNRHCYDLFRECTSLTNVTKVELNATALYEQSYHSMFLGCTNLVTPPEIKATSYFSDSSSNTNGSFVEMFYNCSKLNQIKVHFTSWDNNSKGTKNWTYGTKSTGTFYKPSSLQTIKNTSGNTTNPDNIPYNWTVSNK